MAKAHCYLSVTDQQIADRRYAARRTFGSCHLCRRNFNVPPTTNPKAEGKQQRCYDQVRKMEVETV